MRLVAASRSLTAVILLASLVPVGGPVLGCTVPPGGRKASAAPPDFSGFVTAILPSAAEGIPARIAVESHADKLVTRVLVTITAETRIVVPGEAHDEAADAGALRAYDQVEIWFSAPSRGSSPAEATAEKIVVTGRR